MYKVTYKMENEIRRILVCDKTGVVGFYLQDSRFYGKRTAPLEIVAYKNPVLDGLSLLHREINSIND